MQPQSQHPDAQLRAGTSNIDDLVALLEASPAEPAPKLAPFIFKPAPAPQVTPVAAVATKSIQEQGIETLLGLIREGHALHLRLSGGKDSTSCAMLMIEAVRRAVSEGIRTTHFISSSSTGVENPAFESHLMTVHDEMREYFNEYDLPLELHVTQPSLASSFVVSTVGRGTLPRFPENGKARTCAADWKYGPAQRLASQLESHAVSQTGRGIVTVIGTRLDESTTRKARMESRGESAVKPVRGKSGELVISIIAEWSLDDVWNTLEMLLEPEKSPYASPISRESVHRLFALYSDSNDGTCGIMLGDGGNRSACGSRQGCHTCLIVGDKDKSMESMLAQSEDYAYMRPLNDFRTLLLNTQFDLSTREFVGRTVSPAGYLPVGADVYSFEFRRAMLRYLLTIDANERDRAEVVEAALASGHLEDTKANRLMAAPTFEIVSIQQLAAIDFHWSTHYAAQDAFPAVSIWYEINVLGRRYPVPKQRRADKLTIPTRRWIKVGNFDHAAPSEGMRSVENEMWNRYRHPDRVFPHLVVDGKQTTWFNEADQLSVDAEKACTFITCTYPTMAIECNLLPASESAAFWLNEAIISLPAGHAHRYQNMALRNRYFANLAERFDVAPTEMNRFLMENSISNAEHQRLLPPSPQLDMFKLPDIA